MSVKIKKGRRKAYGEFHVGTLSAKLMPKMKKATIEEIGKQLFKQSGMIKGEVELLHIEFRFTSYEKTGG